MDWTQITMALIVGLPAIIAAAGSFINTIHIQRLKQQNDEVKSEITKEASEIKAQNVVLKADTADQTTTIDKISTATTGIAKAVNGDLDARFRKVEGKIDSLVEAMMEAKILPHNPTISRPPSERR